MYDISIVLKHTQKVNNEIISLRNMKNNPRKKFYLQFSFDNDSHGYHPFSPLLVLIPSIRILPSTDLKIPIPITPITWKQIPRYQSRENRSPLRLSDLSVRVPSIPWLPPILIPPETNSVDNDRIKPPDTNPPIPTDQFTSIELLLILASPLLMLFNTNSNSETQY